MSDVLRPDGAAHQDSQRVELAGRNLLASQLLLAGYELARPERDRGVDLIVYDDRGARFFARPIQMKAYSQAGVIADHRYADIPELLLVYVWHVAEPAKARYFAMTYPETAKLAADLGWADTASWRTEKRYTTTQPSLRVRDALAPYEMVTPNDWRRRMGR